jgi:hypothetical protein
MRHALVDRYLDQFDGVMEVWVVQGFVVVLEGFSEIVGCGCRNGSRIGSGCRVERGCMHVQGARIQDAVV